MLNSKQRAELRAEANGLDPIFQIGKEGVTESVIAQIEDTFNTRELFKVKVHLETSPETPKEIAQRIAEATKCDVVQVVGGKYWDPTATFGQMIAQGELKADDAAGIQAALDTMVAGVTAAE